MKKSFINIPSYVRNEIEEGSLFVVNHSGGKDSQAMTVLLSKIIPSEQVLVIHSELPEVDWEGIPEHIESTIPSDWEIQYTRAAKTFFDMVERRYEKDRSRPCFPSPSIRQCTSDLKRGPIDRVVRHFLKERSHLNKRVVHCVGIRAEESSSRAKALTWKSYSRESKAGREVYHWLPIHELKLDQVLEVIENAGQELHWAYKEGMSRLSCCFCIMANQQDLTIAARLKPDLFKRYVDLEERTGFTMSMSRKPLTEITKVIPIKAVA
jgi:3'-phosphoadenosine 5'-phosphosulfate sulfotransferase (PAPS reductase)/FAD synthetase